MNKLVVPAIIIVGIVFIIISVLSVRKMEFSPKTEDGCNALLNQQVANNLKEGDECAIWMAPSCRRGVYNSGTSQCVSKGSIVPVATAAIGVIAIITGIIMVITRLLRGKSS